jgi:ethanolamine ammonia-lyase small subunit
MSYHELFKNFLTETQARINLGNVGCGLPTKPLLSFRHDHALAKDSVYATIDIPMLQQNLTEIGKVSILVRSQAINREIYLKRPDLGRKLNESSQTSLQNAHTAVDLSFIIADGLSAHAVQVHAVPFLSMLFPMLQNFTIGNIIIAEQARVGISDEIGELCKATISIILIGERPGLSSPDSMGVYLTYKPKVGNTDEKRNCISNIRQKGLSYNLAARKLNMLIRESIRLQLSGVYLKDESSSQSLE